MEMQKASPYRYLAYIASIMMIIGANLPQYIEKGSSDIMKNAFNVDNEGVILYVCALIVIMMRYGKIKKYIISPLIVQWGIIIYYVLFYIKDDNFEMIHIGFILEAAAVVFLTISMFVSIEVKKERVHDMCTLNIKPLEDDENAEKLIAKDVWWILVTVVLTAIMVAFKVKIM